MILQFLLFYNIYVTKQSSMLYQRGTWALEKLLHLAQIWHQQPTLKIETPHSLCCDFGGYKTLKLVGQAAQFKFESKFEPLCRLAISLKAVPEGNRRFRGQNQRPSSWGSSPALLALVGRASTNSGRLRVGGSRCWQRPARLRKTC